MKNRKPEYAFEKGWDKIPNGFAKQAKREIMDAIGITTPHRWYAWLHGVSIPRVDKAKAIESVFKKYGVTDIWGRSQIINK